MELLTVSMKRMMERVLGLMAVFFVLKPCVIERIESDKTTWELEPLTGLAADGQLMAFKHDGFWQPMDTLYEKNYLNQLWISGEAPWKTWD
jgi:glucose-1-phosphate cytidylyltransferase